MARTRKKKSGLSLIFDRAQRAHKSARTTAKKTSRNVSRAAREQGVKPRDIIAFDKRGRPYKPFAKNERPAPGSRRPAVQASGVDSRPEFVGPELWALNQGRSLIRKNVDAARRNIAVTAGDLPPAWRKSMEELAARRAVEQTIRRENYDGPRAYLGRTISNAASTGAKIIVGMPEAMVEGAYLAARGAQALGLAPSSGGVSGQVEAGREVVQRGVVEPVRDYYYPLGRDLIRDPAKTIEERGLEVGLAFGLGWSATGQGLAAAGRAGGRAAQVSRGARQTGSLRGGLRVARGERKRATAQMLRDLQLRDLRATASNGRSVEAPLAFRSAADRGAQARRAAEISGGRAANTLESALERFSDFGSRSALPGAPRYRDPRQATITADVPGGPAQTIDAPRKPRSTNPLTQIVQRRVTEPVAQAARNRIDAKLASRLSLANVFTSFALAASRGARKLGDDVKAGTDAGVYSEARDLAKMIARLKGAGRAGSLPQDETKRGVTAAIIRAMGVAEAKDGSRVWGRDALLSRLNGYLESAEGRALGRREKRAALEQVEILKSIPDEWLDPATSPKWLNELDGEVRRVLRRSTDIKRSVGAITESSAEWGGRRAQAQLGFNGRPLSETVRSVYESPRRDQKRVIAIDREIAARGRGQSAVPSLANYTDDALETMRRNYAQRARVYRSRTKGFVESARREALAAFDEDRTLKSQVDAARARVRELESRPSTAQVRQEIKDARAEYTRIANFEKQRAAARKRMADQGARAEASAAAGRAQRSPEARNRREDLEFDVERAGARVAMARQGRRAMAGAAARRARTRTTAGRRRQTNVNPTVAVSTRQVFEAGQRKGRASVDPSARGFGTMLRADGRLYVVNQRARRTQEARSARQAENERIRREEIEPGVRAQGEAAASRKQLTDAEKRARRELDAARRELAEFNKQSRKRQELTPAQRRASREVAQAGVSRRRAVPPGAKYVYDRVKDLQSALAATRASRNGTPAQIARARRELARAQRNLATARRRYLSKAYVGGERARRSGMAPGEYFPQQSPLRSARDTRFNTLVGGMFDDSAVNEFSARSGASLSPRQEKFNASVLADDGLILLSPSVVINALRSALDVRERAAAASAFVTKYAYKGQDGVPISGDFARQFVDRSRGVYTLISEKQLARISSLSVDSVAGGELRRLLDEMPGNGERMVAVPTAAVRGWKSALDPGGPVGRWVDYVQSLWKGGILALNPRWYIQNFFGMWGQFALGAGADLQAISMARNPKYLEAIPGRISQMGLSQEFGEYARRAQGDPTTWIGRLIRAGYYGNSHLESVPRRAMYWHAAKKGLSESGLMRNGVMDEGVLAAAWLDVARAAGRGDKGANAIVDQALLETERFMGNYSTYNRFERSFLKRVFPFYGWMRAINRLAFALPAKHPKRAALLSAASLMAYDDRNDLSGYQKGLWAGNIQFGMMTANPFAAVLPTMALGNDIGQTIETGPDALNWTSIAAKTLGALIAQTGPVVSEPLTASSGETLAGAPLKFPEGYQGYRTVPGTGAKARINPSTGEFEYGEPSRGPITQALGLLPFSRVVNDTLSGSMRRYDSTNLIDLLSYRFDEAKGDDTDYQRSQLFLPARDTTKTRPWYGKLSQALLGVPIDVYDPNQVLAEVRKKNERYESQLKLAANNQRKPRRNP